VSEGQGDLDSSRDLTFATTLFGGRRETLAGISGRSAARIAGTLTAAAEPIVTTPLGILEGCP